MEGARAIPETYDWAPGAVGTDLAYHARLKRALAGIFDSARPGHRLIDLGCGEGSLDHWLADRGFNVTGIDSSPSGIREARARYPDVRFDVGDIYEPLATKLGTFSTVVSLSVLEHLYSPRRAVDTAIALLEPGGLFICVVPFHGYWKNLAIALTGKFDQHVSSLWDHGHIKFFSERTLSALLTERGFLVERMIRVGCIPPLAKELIAVARRPN
jgi:2-polyprenyl-3-methyl-5-hydroxy-6-metoxy-1,4-benzoquinol methylase